MSQVDLARKLGCPQSGVSRLESGRRSPNLRELVGLAKALNTPLSDLLRELEGDFGMPRGGHSTLSEPAVSYGSIPAFHEAQASEEAVMAQLVIGAVATIAVLGAPALGWCGRRLRRRLEADPAGAPRWLLAGALAALVAGAMPVLAAAVLAGRLAGAGTSRRLRIFQNVGDILFFLIAVLPLAALLANAWTWVRHRRALRAHAQDPPEPATAPG